VSGTVQSGRVYIDGKGIGDVEEMVLRDRRWLSQDGIVLILITIEKPSGDIVVGPDIVTRGFIYEDSSQELLDEVRDLVASTIKELDPEVTADQSLLQARLRNVVKKFFRNTMDRRPMIMPIIIEV
jgi:ribonuclease J